MRPDGYIRPAIILFVEDENSDMEIVRKSFEKKRIANIIEHVYTAEEALGRLYDPVKIIPDLIFVDRTLHSSVLTGDELIESIAKDSRFHDSKLIVLSGGEIGEIEKNKFTELRVDVFFPKPLTPTNFLDMLENTKHLWNEVFVRDTKAAA